MKRKSGVDEKRKGVDPDHLGDKPVLPLPPDEAEVEEGIVREEDDEKTSGVADESDRMTKSGRLSLRQVEAALKTLKDNRKTKSAKPKNVSSDDQETGRPEATHGKKRTP